MRRIALLALALCAGQGSWAALGGEPHPTVASAVEHQPEGATWRELREQLASGTTVRQFVDGRGAVFAVAWSGPFLPDLRSLLGAHFQALDRQAVLGGSRSALVVRRDDLVIVSAGRMGAFEGRAWLPRQLPAGFDPEAQP